MKIELTDVQHRNLLEFLGRVTLKGTEAATFMELARTISTPLKEPILEKEGEEKAE